MRERHELERGVICERCLDTAYKKQYTRIQYTKPVIDSSTGESKNINRINLCNKCFEEYKIMMEAFTGRKFEEVDFSKKKQELISLREQMISAKSIQEDSVKTR